MRYLVANVIMSQMLLGKRLKKELNGVEVLMYITYSNNEGPSEPPHSRDLA